MLTIREVLDKMCCCKACQYYLETIYWHCFEKHFCYDLNIALYEDEDTTKSPSKQEPSSLSDNPTAFPDGKCNANNNIYDNRAFYDNVAILAKRSIFIIDPQDVKTPPKDYEEEQQKSQGKKQSDDEEESQSVITEQPRFSINTINTLDSSFQSETDVSLASSNGSLDYKPKSEPNLASSNSNKEIPIICNTTASLNSLATISEENHLGSASKLDAKKLMPPMKQRKKSLHERRVSRSLTLDIDKRQELPIIRQSSFPKFYIDTPDVGQQAASCIATPHIQALETPVEAKMFQCNLKSIVRLEDERRENQLLHKQVARSASTKENKLMQFRDKLKPIKLLRNASTQSLHNFSHIN